MRLQTSLSAVVVAAAALLGATQAQADTLLGSGPLSGTFSGILSLFNTGAGVQSYTFTLGTADEVITSFYVVDHSATSVTIAPDTYNFAPDGVVATFNSSLLPSHVYDLMLTTSGPTSYYELHVEAGQAFTSAVPEADAGFLALAGLAVVGVTAAARRQRPQA